MDEKDMQRLAKELEEIEKTRELTDEEQREMDAIARREFDVLLTLTKNEPKVTGLKLTNSKTGEVYEWKPEQE